MTGFAAGCCGDESDCGRELKTKFVLFLVIVLTSLRFYKSINNLKDLLLNIIFADYCDNIHRPINSLISFSFIVLIYFSITFLILFQIQ